MGLIGEHLGPLFAALYTSELREGGARGFNTLLVSYQNESTAFSSCFVRGYLSLEKCAP